MITPESDGEQTCGVLVEHREYSDIDGDPAVEMPRVDIARDGPPTSQLCAQIAKVAESAADALRSTSG